MNSLRIWLLQGVRSGIDIPDSPANSDINTTRIAQALAEAQSRGVKVFVRAESKKNLHPTLKYFAVDHIFVGCIVWSFAVVNP